MSRVVSALLVLLVFIIVPFSLPRVAAACGGCFAPMGPPNILTAHRMAVSPSSTQTTLWAQVQDAGAPVHEEVELGLDELPRLRTSRT